MGLGWFEGVAWLVVVGFGVLVGVVRQGERWWWLVSVVWGVWGWGGADCSVLAGLVGVGQQSWGRPRRLARVVW